MSQDSFEESCSSVTKSGQTPGSMAPFSPLPSLLPKAAAAKHKVHSIVTTGNTRLACSFRTIKETLGHNRKYWKKPELILSLRKLGRAHLGGGWRTLSKSGPQSKRFLSTPQSINTLLHAAPGTRWPQNLLANPSSFAHLFLEHGFSTNGWWPCSATY